MDFKDCLQKLEKQGRVKHVKSEVDLIHEVAGIAKKFEGNEILVFDKLKGQNFPLSVGWWWNRDNLASIFDVTAKELPFLFADAVSSINSNPVNPIIVENPPVQQVVMEDIDLNKIPIPTLALNDGGPYWDICVVIAKDPDTGVRNTSVHRFMVTDKNRMGMLMDVGRHLRDYYERAEAKGEPLEITINNGVHPAYYVAAITPSAAAPIDVDELSVASALLESPARLCKSLTVNVEGIADAQLVMEGKILPNVREPEGPFGEVSGYYATREDRWVVELSAITHQENPIIHTLLPGKEVWNSVGLTAEANLFNTLSKQVKGVKNVYISHGGSHYHAIVQQDAPIKEMAKNTILAAFAAFTPLQMVTVVNSDVNIYDAEDVERAMVTRCRPDKDILIIPKALGHELNPVTDNGISAKMGFDCTYPVPKPSSYNKVSFKDVNIDNYEII